MATKIWLGDDAGNEGDYDTAANWSPSGVPGAGDAVIIPASSPAITAGLAQSAVAILSFRVEPGYSATIGSDEAALDIDPDSFDFAGSGLAFIDLHSANITAVVRQTATAVAPAFGLELDGSNLAALDMRGGAVRIKTGATVATIEQHAGRLHVPSGVTLTTCHVLGGSALLESALTTLNVQAGTVETDGAGAITTVTVKGGIFRGRSTGTITTANADGGLLDMLASQLDRTITTLNARGGTVLFNPSNLTITNAIAATRTLRLQAA